ncbi:response regulator [Candidatus Falkowbacteria bacterium]|nr:response regulator [Candidatus Falkowbacteria bacterium]
MATMKKIAVIEDDKFLRKVYESKLPKEGFEVVSAGDGKSGLELIKKEKPDLVLLDLIMPVMTGFEVLEALKADSKFKMPKIIVLSNLGQDEDIARSKELGATDFLIKSNLSIKEIVEQIRQYLV